MWKLRNHMIAYIILSTVCFQMLQNPLRYLLPEEGNAIMVWWLSYKRQPMVVSRERRVEKKEAEETMFEVESPDDLCQYHDHISGPENPSIAATSPQHSRGDKLRKIYPELPYLVPYCEMLRRRIVTMRTRRKVLP